MMVANGLLLESCAIDVAQYGSSIGNQLTQVTDLQGPWSSGLNPPCLAQIQRKGRKIIALWDIGAESPFYSGVRPHMYFNRCILLLVLATMAACADSDSSLIADQFSKSRRESVDLAAAVPGSWDRVCILGPYSNDIAATEALGFEWPAESLTDIERSDEISLLIFVEDQTVTNYIEHPRRSGDFSNLRGRCFPRDNSKFVQVAQPATGWAGLFPADEGRIQPRSATRE